MIQFIVAVLHVLCVMVATKNISQTCVTSLNWYLKLSMGTFCPEGLENNLRSNFLLGGKWKEFHYTPTHAEYSRFCINLGEGSEV